MAEKRRIDAKEDRCWDTKASKLMDSPISEGNRTSQGLITPDVASAKKERDPPSLRRVPTISMGSKPGFPGLYSLNGEARYDTSLAST